MKKGAGTLPATSIPGVRGDAQRASPLFQLLAWPLETPAGAASAAGLKILKNPGDILAGGRATFGFTPQEAVCRDGEMLTSSGQGHWPSRSAARYQFEQAVRGKRGSRLVRCLAATGAHPAARVFGDMFKTVLAEAAGSGISRRPPAEVAT